MRPKLPQKTSELVCDSPINIEEEVGKEILSLSCDVTPFQNTISGFEPCFLKCCGAVYRV